MHRTAPSDRAASRLLRRVRDAAGPPEPAATDGELLARFVAAGDPSAFAVLVRRHGPMVHGVCRRVLGNVADADDAAQATFLVLLRRASSVRPGGRVGGWLHGVACRTALKARTLAAKRRARERAAGRPEAVTDVPTEFWAVLDEELTRLPEKYRGPVVLCDLEGRPYRDAARELGCPEGTLAGRLARARGLLAARLSRRGYVAALGPLGLAVVPDAVAASPALRPVLDHLHGAAAAPARALVLANGVVRMMIAKPLTKAAVAVLAAGLIAAGTGPGASHTPTDDAPPRTAPERPAEPAAAPAARVAVSTPQVFVPLLAWSPDARWLAVAETRYEVEAVLGADGPPTQRAVAKSRVRVVPADRPAADRWQRDGRFELRSVAFSPDGGRLAVVWTSPESVGPRALSDVQLLDAATGRVVREDTVLGPAQLAFAPGGDWLAVATRRTATQPSWPARDVHTVEVSFWGLAAGGAARPQARGAESERLAGPLRWLTVAPDGQALLIGQGDGALALDLRTGVWKPVVAPHRPALTVSPDGRWLLARSTPADGAPALMLVDLQTSGDPHSCRGGAVAARSAAFAADGRTFVTVGREGADRDVRSEVLVWDTARRAIVLRPPLPDRSVAQAAALSVDGRRLAVAVLRHDRSDVLVSEVDPLPVAAAPAPAVGLSDPMPVRINAPRFQIPFRLAPDQAAQVESLFLYGSADRGRTWEIVARATPAPRSAFDVVNAPDGEHWYKVQVVRRDGTHVPPDVTVGRAELVVVVEDGQVRQGDGGQREHADEVRVLRDQVRRLEQRLRELESRPQKP